MSDRLLSTMLLQFQSLVSFGGCRQKRLSRGYTVKPPNRGHFGDGPFVPCREVVLFSEVLF